MENCWVTYAQANLVLTIYALMHHQFSVILLSRLPLAPRSYAASLRPGQPQPVCTAFTHNLITELEHALEYNRH